MKVTFEFENEQLQDIFDRFTQLPDNDWYIHRPIEFMTDMDGFLWQDILNDEISFITILLCAYILEYLKFEELENYELKEVLINLHDYITDHPTNYILHTFNDYKEILVNNINTISNPTAKILVNDLITILSVL